MQKTNAGFTLIELIVVIVILGILAATAAPKFLDVSSDARKASLKGLEAAMRSANSMIYSKAALNGGLSGTAASPVTITVGAASVKVAYGFALDASELAKAMDMSSDYDAASSTAEIRVKNAPTPTKCRVAYTAATSTTTPPIYTSEGTNYNDGC